MSETKFVMINPKTYEEKVVPIGFSWSNLLFAFFLPIYRSDWKWAIIQLIALILTSGISTLIFPFFYNALYRKELEKKGFILKGTSEAKTNDTSSKIYNLEVLKNKYEKGLISKEEYIKRQKDITDTL